MKPAAFDYVRAESVEEAAEALKQYGGDAKVLAGGQSLMPMMNMRLVRPAAVVDIGRIGDLKTIAVRGDRIEIGAGVTQAELGNWKDLARQSPLLAKALPHIGHIQTRNKGTVCGSLAHSDPSSELPLCLATLGGEVELRRGMTARTLNASEFQTEMLTTACEPDEMVTAARFPVARKSAGHAFTEIARRHGDFAIVALAAVAWNGTVRLGVGGVADTPQVREWEGLEGEAIDDALNAFAWEMGGSDDIHATARYRREMVRRLGRKLIEEARDARIP